MQSKGTRISLRKQDGVPSWRVTSFLAFLNSRHRSSLCVLLACCRNLYRLFMHVNAHKVTCGNSGPVRVKGGMSLRNGMWHGLRNDMIMRNLIYGKWRKEKTFNRKACARLCRAFFGANLGEQSICRSICYCYLSKAEIETQLIHEYLINHP